MSDKNGYKIERSITSRWARRQREPNQGQQAWHSSSKAHRKLGKKSKSQPSTTQQTWWKHRQLATRTPILPVHHTLAPYCTVWLFRLAPIWLKTKMRNSIGPWKQNQIPNNTHKTKSSFYYQEVIDPKKSKQKNQGGEIYERSRLSSCL